MAEGVFPKIAGDIAFSKDVNTLRSGWQATFYSHRGLGTAVTSNDTLAHSATTWTRLNGTSTVRTTDSGVTWVAATTDVANMTFGKVSEANKTISIAFTNANLNVAISSDSGDNWTQATTDPADQPYALSFPTATVAVLGTAKSLGARGIYFSTDGGDNWTICTTGPAVSVYAISMFNATTGFAIDAGGNIWKTTDGGDNWTDTTHGSGAIVSGANILGDILATSASTAIITSSSSPQIEIYDGTQNTLNGFSWSDDALTYSTGVPLTPIILTNGDLITGWYRANTNEVTEYVLVKLASTTDKFGQVIRINWPTSHSWKKDTTDLVQSSLQEYDTNKIMLVTNNGYQLLDTT